MKCIVGDGEGNQPIQYRIDRKLGRREIFPPELQLPLHDGSQSSFRKINALTRRMHPRVWMEVEVCVHPEFSSRHGDVHATTQIGGIWAQIGDSSEN